MGKKSIWHCGHCGQAGHNVITCQNPGVPEEKKLKRGAPLGNFNGVQHGFYSPRFLKREIEMLDLVEDENDVSSEIILLRVALDRAAARLTDALDSDQTVALLNVITRAAAKLSHIMKDQKALFGQGQSLSEFLDGALADVIEQYEREREQIKKEGEQNKKHQSVEVQEIPGLKDA